MPVTNIYIACINICHAQGFIIIIVNITALIVSKNFVFVLLHMGHL